MSPPPPPPPGITPIREQRRPSRSDQRPGSPGDQVVQVPTPRPTPERSARGSRADWPTRAPDDDWAAPNPDPGRDRSRSGGDPATGHPTPGAPGGPGGPASAGGPGGTGWTNGASPALPDRTSAPVPPRRDGEQRQHPPEPRPLRLVEPTLPEELRGDLGFPPARPEPPPLRLVGANGNGVPRSAPPVSADAGDDDLLIFAQTRSAWFDQSADTGWESEMDLGWRAAEQAAQPTVGDRTGAGLPRRVPHANLVPGAPPRRDDRPLRVVRDPASIAAHTSGYFSGWRRGQEVGGYPLGGRTGRQAAGAWEFHRDEDRLSG